MKQETYDKLSNLIVKYGERCGDSSDMVVLLFNHWTHEGWLTYMKNNYTSDGNDKVLEYTGLEKAYIFDFNNNKCQVHSIYLDYSQPILKTNCDNNIVAFPHICMSVDSWYYNGVSRVDWIDITYTSEFWANTWIERIENECTTKYIFDPETKTERIEKI